MYMKIWPGNLKERDHMDVLVEDGKKTLKWILSKQVMRYKSWFQMNKDKV
jgi:hypothetical protein